MDLLDQGRPRKAAELSVVLNNALCISLPFYMIADHSTSWSRIHVHMVLTKATLNYQQRVDMLIGHDIMHPMLG